MKRNWQTIIIVAVIAMLMASAVAAVVHFLPQPHGRHGNRRSVVTSGIGEYLTTTVVTGCYTATIVVDRDGNIVSAITIDHSGQIIDTIEQGGDADD